MVDQDKKYCTWCHKNEITSKHPDAKFCSDKITKCAVAAQNAKRRLTKSSTPSTPSTPSGKNLIVSNIRTGVDGVKDLTDGVTNSSKLLEAHQTSSPSSPSTRENKTDGLVTNVTEAIVVDDGLTDGVKVPDHIRMQREADAFMRGGMSTSPASYQKPSSSTDIIRMLPKLDLQHLHSLTDEEQNKLVEGFLSLSVQERSFYIVDMQELNIIDDTIETGVLNLTSAGMNTEPLRQMLGKIAGNIAVYQEKRRRGKSVIAVEPLPSGDGVWFREPGQSGWATIKPLSWCASDVFGDELNYDFLIQQSSALLDLLNKNIWLRCAEETLVNFFLRLNRFGRLAHHRDYVFYNLYLNQVNAKNKDIPQLDSPGLLTISVGEMDHWGEAATRAIDIINERRGQSGFYTWFISEPKAPMNDILAKFLQTIPNYCVTGDVFVKAEKGYDPKNKFNPIEGAKHDKQRFNAINAVADNQQRIVQSSKFNQAVNSKAILFDPQNPEFKISKEGEEFLDKFPLARENIETWKLNHREKK